MVGVLGCKGGSGLDREAVLRVVVQARTCKDAACVKAATDQLAALVPADKIASLSAPDKQYLVDETAEVLAIGEKLKPAKAAAPAGDRLSRYELLSTTYLACRTAMIPSDATPEQQQQFTAYRDDNAKRMARVGAKLEPYPTPVGDAAKDTQLGMMWYLGAMSELGKRVDAYPDRDKYLVMVGQMACLWLVGYTPDAPNLDAQLPAFGRLARATEIDGATVGALVDALTKKPPTDQGRDAAAAFLKAALAQLHTP